MKLYDLIKKIGNKDNKGVPDWMLGYFKRRTISFYDGRSDNTTDVCWIQSRSFTIDLRLPKVKLDKKDTLEYSKDELEQIANYEGWVADSIYDGEKLFWDGGIAYQNRNKWPEPAFLKKVGNCMMEFCPSNVYVEDWRLQNEEKDSLVGLRLVSEIDLETGEVIREDGGLIICGEYAAICLGRDKELEKEFASCEPSLEDMLLDDSVDDAKKQELMKFEVSVAKGDFENGFDVILSTNPNRYDEKLISLDGYELDDDGEHIVQNLSIGDEKFKRVYKIDIIDAEFDFQNTTTVDETAKEWFKKEEKTLSRYLEVLK